MTAPPRPQIYSDVINDLQISYFDTQDFFPFIVDVSIKGVNLSERIKDSIKIIKYKVKSSPLWDEELELPNSINNIMDDVFKAIVALYDSNQKRFSVSLADYFFNLYANVSWSFIEKNGSKNLAYKFFEKLLLKSRELETKKGILIHKGTPYYFLTSIYMSMNDIDSGFASMFKAIEEDKRTKCEATNNEYEYKNSPAYKYISLIDDSHNYLYESIMNIRNFLNDVIIKFNNNTVYNLSLNDVDQKFLNNDDFEELKYVFVYALEKYLKYKKQFLELKISNQFYAIKNSSNIFDLCIIIDKILEKKYEHKYRITFPRKRLYLGGLIWCLFDEKGWISNISDAGILKEKITPNILDMSPNNAFSHINAGSITINGAQLTNEMGVMLLLWGLRNWSAHNVKLEKVFVDNYDELFEKLLWSFLVAIENI